MGPFHIRVLRSYIHHKSVIAVENSIACEGYESTRHAGTNNVILLPENVNQMMGI